MAAHCCSQFQRRCRKMAGTIGSAGTYQDLGDDWVTLVIGETGAYEFASYRMIGVFARERKTSFDRRQAQRGIRKGRPNDAAAAPLRTPEVPDRVLRVVAKDSEGFHYWADLKRAPLTLSPRRSPDS